MHRALQPQTYLYMSSTGARRWGRVGPSSSFLCCMASRCCRTTASLPLMRRTTLCRTAAYRRSRSICSQKSCLLLG